MNRLVLGGGANQLDLLKKARKRGDYIVLVDYLSQPAGARYADVHLQISTFDSDAVSKACRDYMIDSVVTAGTDQPVLTAAIASKNCTYDFYLDETTAFNVTNKKAMKEMFLANNIPTVPFQFLEKDFDNDKLSKIAPPYVMKPLDTQGQRGIFKVNSIEEIRMHFDETLSFSRENQILVEAFYENDEITVNGWVQDGELTILSVVDRVTINESKHIGVCLCHNHPSLHLEDYHSEIEDITHKIVKTFNIINGPIYFQYLIGHQGLLVNEIACRVGGAFEGTTLPYLVDFDINEAVLSYPEKLEINVNSNAFKTSKKYLSTQLFFCEPGVVKSITGQEIFEEDFILDASLNYSIGDVIPKLENATARAGYFIAKGTSYAKMIENVNKVFDELKICDESNLLKKYVDYKERYKFTDKDNYIVRKASLEEMQKLWNYSGSNNYNNFSNLISQEIVEFWTIEHQQELIAELFIFWDSLDKDEANGKDRAYLCAFRVNEKHQGKGLSTKLMQAVLKRVEEKGFNEVTIGVDPDEEEKLINIYTKWGFTTIVKKSYVDIHDIGKDGEFYTFENPSTLLLLELNNDQP